MILRQCNQVYLPNVVTVRHSDSKLTVVGLPGAGFDHTFIEQSLSPLAETTGARLVSVDPEPGNVLDGYLSACDLAAESGPFICVGISIGAIAAMRWWIESRQKSHWRAIENCCGIIVSMAPWSGRNYDSAPAAQAASGTAKAISQVGFGPVREAMVKTSPLWLSELQVPCWDRLGSNLATIMEEASTTQAPEVADLRTITCPCGLIRVLEDPLHPVSVTDSWAHALLHCEVETISLNDIASSPTIFSNASLKLLQKLQVRKTSN